MNWCLFCIAIPTVKPVCCWMFSVVNMADWRSWRVARVAPTRRCAGVLMSFQPVSLSWFGKGEVRTLHSAEWQGGQPYLQGTALMCGFYLNELLINLLARDDAHIPLFDYYRAALYRLAHETDHAASLRCFEKHLLQELGYALELAKEAGGRTARASRARLSLCRGAWGGTGERYIR